MTANGKRSVSVGQTAKHRGADCEITNVAPDGENVKVTYPFSPSKRPMWVRLEDLHFPDSLSTSPNTSPVPELYPVGTVLTNGAKESVKVVANWKGDVRLQLGTKNGDTFQPSDDEPFTMSEQDVHEWLSKTSPSAAADTMPMPLPLHTWEVGQRARLLCDMPHDFSPLKEGDEGIVAKMGIGLGFKPDGLRAGVAYRSLNGKTVFVLDHCEFVADGNPTPQEVTPKAESDDPQALREQIKFLEQQIESLLSSNNLLNREHDELMQAREDNGKLMAALEDAQRSVRQLEKKNNQQSEMLREAVSPPQPSSLRGEGVEAGRMHLKTIMTNGGSNGFANVDIPHGYQIVAVTTEVYDGKLTRLTHLMGCGDSPAPHETLSEKVTVGFEQVTIHGLDDAPLPLEAAKVQNEFEIAMKSGASPEEIIRIGNERVVEKAWNAAQAYRTSHPASPSSNKLLIGEGYG